MSVTSFPNVSCTHREGRGLFERVETELSEGSTGSEYEARDRCGEDRTDGPRYVLSLTETSISEGGAEKGVAT